MVCEDKQKPCGYDGHCPLVDECRLFAEAQEILSTMGLARKEEFQIVCIAIKKWCKNLAAIEIQPVPRVCRDVMQEAAEEMRRAPRERRIQVFIVALYRTMRALEQTQSRDLHKLVDRALRDAAF